MSGRRDVEDTSPWFWPVADDDFKRLEPSDLIPLTGLEFANLDNSDPAVYVAARFVVGGPSEAASNESTPDSVPRDVEAAGDPEATPVALVVLRSS